MIETKARILDAAERLIAERGLDVSLRAITTAASVNLAAVNYHFQSKDALLDAVIARRIEPINRVRLEMLDTLEGEYPSGVLPLEPVLEAFLTPVLQMEAGDHVRVLFGRFYNLPDEFLNRVFFRHLQPVLERFHSALGRALPGLSSGHRMACMMFTAGAMVHVMAWSKIIGAVTGGGMDVVDRKSLTEQMVTFAAAGIRAIAKRSQSAHQGTRHA